MENLQATQWCRLFISQQVKPGDLCIDATAGNGFDTELLCRLAGEQGQVLAFDVQKQALESTKQRLLQAGLMQRTRLILDGHEHMGQYAKVGSVSCIVFNFGYLPGGDHRLATRLSTSLEAVTCGLSLLKSGGLMSLCIYSGGDTGYEEREGLLTFLKGLDSQNYLVVRCEYYNRGKNPPLPVLVIKI